ncbi:MAG: flagellar hook-associated protein FlgK [Pseudomonadota bacterium]
MSITSALSAAVSGLSANARAAGVVSSNVANAQTPGYARRELELSTRYVDGSTGGVQVDGVRRVVDKALIQDRQLADSALANSDTRTQYLSAASDLWGSPESDLSLSGRIRQFDASLIEAASRPDEPSRLTAVGAAAQALTDALNAASAGVQDLREEADAAIARDVALLNASLAQVQDLNGQISRQNGAGRDVAALLDERQRVVDTIAEIVPVRSFARDDDRIALVTTGGAVLIDGTAREIEFAGTGVITADMTLASGALSDLEIDGRGTPANGTFAPLGGGRLGALFEVRDTLAVADQARLDGVARDLVDRFADPAIDPTRAPGDPGLFTDGGLAFAPADEIGLSRRIDVNALVDPARGGALFRLRDGLGAAAPGPGGDATLLQSFSDALGAQRVAASPALDAGAEAFDALVAELTSRAASDLRISEREQGFRAAFQLGLAEQEAAGGVDTDQELQKLILIEQNYAANARVIQVIDDMLQQLVRI